MAPHITELLFAAGGGARVVGAMNFSDYPPAAASIPLVGSSSQIDMERLVALKPDLLVVWQGGNTTRQLEQLRQLGLPMYYSDPRQIDAIPASIVRFGKLMGTGAVADGAAADLRTRAAALAARYAQRPPVRMFYQIWDKPLFTLNGKQVVSDAMRLCGGVNIFAALPVTAPEVSIEAVIAQDPEVIIGGAGDELTDAGLAIWKPYGAMRAVKRGNLFALAGGRLSRPGPRMLDGTGELCEKLELARQRRP